MRVQHPDKEQYEIAPAGIPPFVTDERGIVDLSDAIPDRTRAKEVADSLIEQGWERLKSDVKASGKEPESVAPAVENDVKES
jgi:hypothetical protein